MRTPVQWVMGSTWTILCLSCKNHSLTPRDLPAVVLWQVTFPFFTSLSPDLEIKLQPFGHESLTFCAQEKQYRIRLWWLEVTGGALPAGWPLDPAWRFHTHTHKHDREEHVPNVVFVNCSLNTRLPTQVKEGRFWRCFLESTVPYFFTSLPKQNLGWNSSLW